MDLSKFNPEQQVSIFQGLQSIVMDTNPDAIGTSRFEGLSEAGRSAQIDMMNLHNGTVFSRGLVRTGPVELTNANPQAFSEDEISQTGGPPQLRAQVQEILGKGQAANPMQFEAILAFYNADVELDGTLTAEEIAQGATLSQSLESGDSAPEIRNAFDTARTQAAAEEARQQAAAEAAQRAEGMLETNIDAALAAQGYIEPGQELTDQQRAIALNTFMKENSFAVHAAYGGEKTLVDIQSEAFGGDFENWQVSSAALGIVSVNFEKDGLHMAEEVKAWLESGDPAQIQMAQAVIGVDATGTLSTQTYEAGNAYLNQDYATKLGDIPAFSNGETGGFQPVKVYTAARDGTLYTPETDEEMRAAGFTDGQIEAINAAVSTEELNDVLAKGEENWTEADREILGGYSREEMIAQMYINDPALYERVIENRNDVNVALDDSLRQERLVDVAQNAAVESRELDAQADTLEEQILPDSERFDVVLGALSDGSVTIGADSPPELAELASRYGTLVVAEEAVESYRLNPLEANNEHGVVGAVGGVYAPLAQQFDNDVIAAQNNFMDYYNGLDEAQRQAVYDSVTGQTPDSPAPDAPAVEPPAEQPTTPQEPNLIAERIMSDAIEGAQAELQSGGNAFSRLWDNLWGGEAQAAEAADHPGNYNNSAIVTGAASPETSRAGFERAHEADSVEERLHVRTPSLENDFALSP